MSKSYKKDKEFDDDDFYSNKVNRKKMDKVLRGVKKHRREVEIESPPRPGYNLKEKVNL